MKNFAYLLTFPLLLFACSSEIEEADISQGDKTSIDISIPMPDDMKTRGFSDGSSINNLKCYVYGRNKGTDADPLFIEDIVLKNYPDHLGSHYSLYLPYGQAYDLVFFATCGAQDDPDGKLFYDRKARTVTMDYNSAVTNDESIDCFFGSIQEVSPAKGTSYSVTLKRPYAQLNIGTKDISDYNAMSYSPFKAVAVTVDGIYSSFSAMDGSIIGGVSKLSFPQSERPSGQTFPVAGYDYLSMNYLLVNQQKKVDVTMTVWNQSSSFDCSFSQIPLQRNCRTNIYGHLLTKSNDYKVEINNLYDGNDDTEVDKYFGYDLVVKVGEAVSGSTRPTKPGNPDEEDEDSDTRPVKPGTGDEGTETENKQPRLCLYYQLSETAPLDSIDLTNYIDNTNTLKVSWEELGLTSAYNVRFVKEAEWSPRPNSTSGTTLTELIKFDYQKLNIKSFNSLFAKCMSLTEIHGMDKWDTSSIVDMSKMFFYCNKLPKIDVSHFDTRNVTDMSEMFANTDAIIDLTGFDTSNVTDMNCMFLNCENLTSIDVSKFNTAECKNMYGMFCGCENLNSLDVSHFNTANVTDMAYMFCRCENLNSLDVSHFNTANVTDMSHMFDTCKKLTSIDVSKFDTSRCMEMHHMFNYCENLNSLDVSHFNTANVNCFCSMFENCHNLSFIDVSHFNTANSQAFDDMFSECSSITTIDVSNFNTSNATYMKGMFHNCNNLTSLDVRNFDISKVRNMEAFASGSKLQTIYISFNYNDSQYSNSWHHGFGIDFTPNYSFTLNAPNIVGQITNLKTTETLNLYWNDKWTYDSFMKVIDGLGTNSARHTLYVNTTQYNWLGYSKRSELSTKNWNVLKKDP